LPFKYHFLVPSAFSMAGQQAEKEREKQPVSADALAALTARFNKH
jgi:hypothetical protein